MTQMGISAMKHPVRLVLYIHRLRTALVLSFIDGCLSMTYGFQPHSRIMVKVPCNTPICHLMANTLLALTMWHYLINYHF